MSEADHEELFEKLVGTRAPGDEEFKFW
jgi:hypothetical protein